MSDVRRVATWENLVPLFRGRPRFRAVLGGSVLIAMLSSTACSPHHSQSSGDGRRAPVTPSLLRYPSFPLDQYRPTTEQRRTLLSAEFRLADVCAARHRIKISLPLPASRSDFLLMYAASLRPVTMSDARTLGYRLPPSGTSPSDEAIAHLPPDEAETMIGWNSASNIPRPTSTFLLAGGCIGQAVRYLTADPHPSDADEQYVDQLINESVGWAQASAELAGPIRQWSNCMASSGYDGFRTPRDAVMGAPRGGEVTADEVKQATQDVSCKDSSGLTDTWTSLISKHQREAIAAHKAELDAIKARLDQRLERAAAVGK